LPASQRAFSIRSLLPHTIWRPEQSISLHSLQAAKAWELPKRIIGITKPLIATSSVRIPKLLSNEPRLSSLMVLCETLNIRSISRVGSPASRRLIASFFWCLALTFTVELQDADE
jgi:hypothetical protein